MQTIFLVLLVKIQEQVLLFSYIYHNYVSVHQLISQTLNSIRSIPHLNFLVADLLRPYYQQSMQLQFNLSAIKLFG